MIPLMLLDIILSNNTTYIPCFFLVGFYKDKKISLLEYTTIFLVMDLWIYKTKGFFCILLLLLNLIKERKNKKNIFKFNIILVIFFSLIILKNKYSLFLILDRKILFSLFLANLLYISFPKLNIK